ncbi:hypothetical protein OC25_26425 [Pedobacter kyungheensis]|uniref:Uncharacterized protein n=1 Tax=Pedobacter kyungheensis TaxID=1069985 RepID=A0A0C1F4U7_9SPHI|nr:hypothetical protein OC25_26425 [Pedobacter kyungheensis]
MLKRVQHDAWGDPLHPVLRHRRFSQEKARKDLYSLSSPLPKAGTSACIGQGVDKRLETAAIQLFVAFYKNCAAIFYTDKNNIIA